MQSLKATAFLEFNENQLYEVRKLYNYGDKNRLLQDINLLEDWIEKQNHFRVRKFDREYLERYLIYNKGSIERVKKRFDKLCTLRNLMPDFLQNFDIRKEFIPLRCSSYFGYMPRPTPDNYRIAILRFFGHHDQLDLMAIYRYIYVLAEYVLHHDYCTGFEFIIDTRDMPVSLVTKFNPIVINKALSLIVETMGQRVKNFHLISGFKFFDTIVSLFKQGMSEKLAKRLKVHDSLESIYKVIDKDNLPSEYGGKGKTLKELDEILFETLSSDEHIERIKFLETASTDESCRVIGRFNEQYSGMPGSFKNMCLD